MTTNAQELWASTNHFRREGGPGMPLQMEHPRNNNTSDPFVNYGWDRPHAAAILRDHGRMWLENNRCMPQSERREYSTDPKVEPSYAVEIYFEMTGEKREFVRPTMLAAINAAIGAYLAAKKGK